MKPSTWTTRVPRIQNKTIVIHLALLSCTPTQVVSASKRHAQYTIAEVYEPNEHKSNEMADKS